MTWLVDLVARLLRRRRLMFCLLVVSFSMTAALGCAPIGGGAPSPDHDKSHDSKPATTDPVEAAAAQFIRDYSSGSAAACDDLAGKSFDSWDAANEALGQATADARTAASAKLEAAMNANKLPESFDSVEWRKLLESLARGFRGATK